MRAGRRRDSLVVAVLAMTCAVAAAEVRVSGKVRHTGFPCGGADAFRPGYWCPALVSLKNSGDEHLNARLVLRQRDKDGDVIVAESVVTLTAGGEERPYRLDFIANRPNTAGAFLISLIDEDGRSVPIHSASGVVQQALPAPQVMPINEQTTLVIDLSSRPLSGLDLLSDANEKKLRRPLLISRFRPEDLPDRWFSLRGAQAIIWDRPEVDRLSPQQIQALITYVRAGGTLVLAAGRTFESLEASPLGTILPVTGSGTRSVEQLPQAWSKFLRPGGWTGSVPMYVPPITVADVRGKPGAVVWCREDALGLPSIVRWRWGSGLVVFVAGELRDLFQITDQAGQERFYKASLGLLEEAKGPEQKQVGWMGQADLYDHMHGIIAFEAVGGSFLILVVLLVGAYILLASLATWGWLRNRNALEHCWTAFAVVALCCSVLGVVAVQTVRGFGTRLRQTCIVDVSVPANNRGPLEYQGVGYFGLKTSTHVDLDVRVASGERAEGSARHRSFLKPLASNRMDLAQSYVAPDTYFLRPGRAMLESVAIRGTLKRFEGCWFGTLKGGFGAMLEVDATGRLSGRSWLRNDLGFDLVDCWLLLPRTDRIGGMGRDTQIYLFEIGRLPHGEGAIKADELRIQPEDRLKWPRLSDRQSTWASRFSVGTGLGWGEEKEKPRFEMGTYHTALMLLTTLEEFDEMIGRRDRHVELNRSQGLHLDRTHLMTRETAVVIGFAHDPGPVRLEVRPTGGDEEDWEDVEPDEGEERAHTMYRFFVPLHGLDG